MYLGLYDAPDVLRSVAELCANLWREVASALAARNPRWQGGYVDS